MPVNVARHPTSDVIRLVCLGRFKKGLGEENSRLEILQVDSL